MSIADEILNKAAVKSTKLKVVKDKNPSKLRLIEIYIKQKYDIRFNTVSNMCRIGL